MALERLLLKLVSSLVKRAIGCSGCPVKIQDASRVWIVRRVEDSHDNLEDATSFDSVVSIHDCAYFSSVAAREIVASQFPRPC